ncbi:MAG: hypothetical protein JWN48_5165 [Myxococcaceae bacterium]|nr:hypothetical protein [Myxococcaceae bacterium]
MSQHIALLGDSIFDNASYTRGAPDVVTHLARLLPKPWRASLLAVDGATVPRLGAQLERVEPSVSHLVISVGGNDALQNIDMLNMRVSSTRQALLLFEQRIERFEREYRRAIVQALGLSRPTTLCTIYNGNLPAGEADAARMALMMFNDVIARVAYEQGLDLIELRLVCTEPGDYANPIEPSDQGGAKIARAVASALGLHSHPKRSRTFF